MESAVTVTQAQEASQTIVYAVVAYRADNSKVDLEYGPDRDEMARRLPHYRSMGYIEARVVVMLSTSETRLRGFKFGGKK